MSDHEIRVALVMNGGVSLAVWMGGVTHELDLIRRASSPTGSPPSQAYDRPLARRWKELLRPEGELDQRRVVVDVIAGTSAGGLNGAMLATAIAHGTTLDPSPRAVGSAADPTSGQSSRGPWLREQWSALGAVEVGQLLPAEGRRTSSVLDGDYFLGRLRDLLSTLAEGGNSDDASTVTLFTPASGLGDQGFTARDAARQPFQVADHRVLYKFSNDNPRRYEPKGQTFTRPVQHDSFADADLLARASRASASFPVAFSPVKEADAMKTRPPRERLLAGGDDTDPGRSDCWLVDGGVLDNAPFSPVLDVVARRPLSGRASRYVVYVVPSSGVGARAESADPQGAPDWRTTALSAVRFPREADFRGDVEELERLLVEADASWSDTQRLFDRAMGSETERSRLTDAAAALLPAYVRGRAAGGVWEAITLSQSAGTTVLDSAAALTEQDVDSIISSRPAWVPADGDSVPTWRSASRQASTWPWGTGPAERVVRLVLRHLRGRLDEVARGVTLTREQRREETAYLEELLATVSDILQNVLAVRDSLTDDIVAKGFTAQTSPAQITGGLNEIFEKWQVRAALGAQIDALTSKLPDQTVATAVAVEIVSRCTSARTPNQRSAPFKFVRLGPDIALPLLADAGDRTLAENLKDRILYGTQVGHFGAFGAGDWRRWDWLMGRLHAVAHLGSLLHPGPQEARDAWVSQTQRDVLAAEGWAMEEFTSRLHHLDRAFGSGAATTPVAVMLDELKATPRGRQTVTSLVDRLVQVSNGLGTVAGTWVPLAIAREQQPAGQVQRLARWFTEPARGRIWRRLVSDDVELDSTDPPWPVSGWLWPAAAALAVASLVGAFVLALGPESGVAPSAALVFAVFAGAAALVAIELFVARRQVVRARDALQRKVGGLLDKQLDGST